MKWYSLSMSIPIQYQNITSQYEILLNLTDVVNGVAKDVCRLVEIEANRPDFAGQIKTLQNTVKTMQTQLKNAIDELGHTQQALISVDEEIKQLRIYTDGRIETLSGELIATDLKWQKNLQIAFNNLQDEIENTNNLISNTTDIIKADLKAYADSLYKPKNIYYVTNPITDNIGEINDVLAMLWDFTALIPTISEFDSMGLTIGEFETYGLTILEYMRDFHKRITAHNIQDAFMMFNPLTGTRMNVKNIVYDMLTSELVLPYSIKIGTFEKMGLLNKDVDALGVTCYDFYVNASNILKEDE